MGSLEIDVKVTGVPNAASDLKSLGDAAQQSGDRIKTAGSDIQSTTSRLSDFKSNLAGVVGSFTAIGNGALDIMRSFTQLEQAQIRLDTANKRVQSTTIALEAAQRKYNDAVAKYGANSQQAQTAAQKLEVATKNHEIAVDRANLQQEKFNETLAELATHIVPDAITVFGSIIGIIGNFTQKNQDGVTMLGKLKQSFSDLVSGGSQIENTVSNASNAISGLGSRAGTAGTAASGLKNEVAQLGSGIAQSIPNIGQFSGGITNTAVAAERSAGPLGNIERSIATVAPAAAGAVTPLSSFGSAVGEAGAATAETAGTLESAAVSTGVFAEGTTAAATESVAMAGAVGGITVATAAMTAGIGLAVAAIVAYVFNIGGFRDKTNEAIDAAKNFLEIGWSSFTERFKPVTDAIDGAIKKFAELIGKAGDFLKLGNASGQFGKLPGPGQEGNVPSPESDKTLQQVIDFRSEATQLLPGKDQDLSTILLGGGGVISSDSLQSLDDLKSRMHGVVEEMTPMNTGVRNSGENFKVMAEQSKAAAAGIQSTGSATQQATEATKAAVASDKERQESITAAMNAMQQTIDVTKTANSLAIESAAARDSERQTLDQLDTSLGSVAGQYKANTEILTTSVGQQKLFNDGWNQQALAIQNAQKALIESNGALQSLRANLDVAKVTAFGQGWVDTNTQLLQAQVDLEKSKGSLLAMNQQLATGVPQQTAFTQGMVDFNMQLDQMTLKTANAAGQFKSMMGNLATGRDQFEQFNAGFVDGETSIGKWVESMSKAEGEMGGVRNGLTQLAKIWHIDLPDAINASNDTLQAFENAMHGTVDAMTKGFADSDKILQNAVKNWQKFQEELNKPASSFQDAMKNRGKAWQDELQNEIQTYGGFLTNLQRATIDGFARINTVMQQSQNRLGIDLAGQDIQGFQRDWNNAINSMKATAQSLPPAARPAFETLINLMQRLPVNNAQQAADAMSFFGQAVSATQNPGTQLNPVINNLQSYLGKIGQSNAGQSVQQFGTAVTGATGGVQQFSLGMQAAIDLNQGFARGVDDAAGSLNSLVTFGTTKLNTLQIVLQNLAVQFNTTFQTGVQDAAGSITQFVQFATTSLNTLQIVLQNLSVQFNTVFQRGVQDAAGSITQLVQFATSSLNTLQIVLQNLAVQFNTTFSRGVQDAAGSINQFVQFATNGLNTLQIVLQNLAVQFNTTFARAVDDAAGSINKLRDYITKQLINPNWTVTVHVDTSAAEQKIASLQQKLNALNGQQGLGYPTSSPYGYPVGYAATGGTFALDAGGFRKTSPEILHAAKGGSFIVTKQMKFGNLVVGEGNKPELVTYFPEKNGRHNSIGMLTVVPLPKIHAATGGAFPVFGSAPGPGLFPGAGFTPTTNPNPTIINYGGIPAPKQTAGQGGPQLGPPSTEGAGTILVAPGGNAVTGPVTSPPKGSLIPGAPAPGTMSIPGGSVENITPYTMAQMTGEAVASNLQPSQQQQQADISQLLAMVKKLLSRIASRDMNANLFVDGQKMATTVSKYMGSNAYGGR
jgi:exonuclease VII small subunit